MIDVAIALVAAGAVIVAAVLVWRQIRRARHVMGEGMQSVLNADHEGDRDEEGDPQSFATAATWSRH